MIKEDSKSAEIIKPVLRGRDVERYNHNWDKTKLWLIATFPSLDLDIDRYPAVKKHLLSFGKERLEQAGRTLLDGTKSRKKTTHSWYELQDTCAYHAEFTHDKIVWSDISTEPTFHVLEREMYINNTGYMIVGNNLKYLLGVLNSSVIAFYLPMIATGLGKKGIRYFKQFVEKLPVPRTNEKTCTIVQLVDKMISQKKDGKNTDSLESEIDRLVYQLYGLTEAEIHLVEDRK